MSSQYKNIAIIGAKGNVGSSITRAILESSLLKLTILSRKNGTSSFPAGVAIHKVDYNSRSELVAALQGIDAIVCAIGATGFGEQKRIIDAAIEAGVQRYLPSEFSSNTMSSKVQELVPAFRPKIEVMEYLRSKESATFTWTGICTGPLFDWVSCPQLFNNCILTEIFQGLQVGFLGFDIVKETATIWDDGNAVFTGTTEADLGKAIVNLMQQPEKTANRYLYLSSVKTSQNEILEAAEKVTGKTWKVNLVETDAQIELGRKMVSAGDFNGMLLLVQASFWGNDGAIRSDLSKEDTLANNMLGLEAGSVQEIVSKVHGSSLGSG